MSLSRGVTWLVANTLINHNNGLPGKKLVTVASHTPDVFGVLIQSSEVACFMHPSMCPQSVRGNHDGTLPVIVLPLPIGDAGVRYHGFCYPGISVSMNFETPVAVGPLVVDGDKRGSTGPTAVHVPTLSLPSLPFVIPNLLYGA